MIHDTWRPNAVGAGLSPPTTPGFQSNFSVSAQISDDSKTLVVRYTNSDPAPQQVTVALTGVARPLTATSLTPSSPDLLAANSPGDPSFISPVEKKEVWQPADDDDTAVTVPGKLHGVGVRALAACAACAACMKNCQVSTRMRMGM